MSPNERSPGGLRWIVGSVAFAVVLEQLPWSGWGLALRPDFVLVTLLFWTLYQPLRIGFGTAFVLGLVADFQDGALFGQYASGYVIGVYLVQFLRLRLLQFDPLRQAAQLFPILLAVQIAVLLVGWLAINPPGGLEILLAAPSSALLWLLVAGLLRVWHGKSLRDTA
jgi:rod shape-determining protein MreD